MVIPVDFGVRIESYISACYTTPFLNAFLL